MISEGVVLWLHRSDVCSGIIDSRVFLLETFGYEKALNIMFRALLFGGDLIE